MKYLSNKCGTRSNLVLNFQVEELVYGAHIFTHIMVNIPTQCEVCNSFLWLSMKALTCQSN